MQRRMGLFAKTKHTDVMNQLVPDTPYTERIITVNGKALTLWTDSPIFEAPCLRLCILVMKSTLGLLEPEEHLGGSAQMSGNDEELERLQS